MKTDHFILFFFCLVFASCSPRIRTTIISQHAPLDYEANVAVIELNENIPLDAEIIGQVRIGDSGFSVNCDYATALASAKLEARKVGGNAIKITEHKLPSAMGSTCHRIKAQILKVENPDLLPKSMNQEEIIEGADYALVHIYRYGGAGALIGYDLYLGQEQLCRVVNSFKTTIEVKQFGMNSIWARTEVKEEIPIDIEAGKHYYIRCSLGMGAFIGRPRLELVDWQTGKIEFESLNAKHQ